MNHYTFFQAQIPLNASLFGGNVMAKMIAVTTQMNQTLVDLLLVVQDSFSVTILIAFFQCIFAIAMMIAEINLMRKIALNILAMGNNSNASKKMRMGPLFLDFVYLRTEGMYILYSTLFFFRLILKVAST